MKLVKARVTNFRSIEDSGEFTIDAEGNITCFVGKNESGKTSLLRALHRLNPTSGHEKFDKEKDYPRRFLTEYDERHGGKIARAVTAWFRLDESEMEAIAEVFGPNALSSNEVVAVGTYEHAPYCYPTGINQKAIVKHLIETNGLYEEEQKKLGVPAKVEELLAVAKKCAAEENASPAMKTFPATIEGVCPKGDVYAGFTEILSLPKFLFVSSYQHMDGQVSVDAIMQRKSANKLTENDEVFLALCQMAGTSIEEIQGIATFENLVAKFEGASTRISKEVFKYWSQNRHLKIQMRRDDAQPKDPPPFNSGKIVRTRILNTLHDVTVPFDDRSTGFVWFFSFVALFSQVRKQYQGDLIILLDEPGLSLHGTAQADLLRYFKEKLAPGNQLLYTTHSPFMVPSDNLSCCRTVEDVIERDADGEIDVKGTKVGSDVLSTDKETLFPLQGALGYHISQSLFVGEHTLIVEGPSDILFLQAVSHALKEKKRTGLDSRWVMCPAGSIDKVPAFLSLFGGNNLHLAVLTDYADGQRKSVSKIRDSEMLKANHVFTATMFVEQKEADIEDMLGEELYLHLVTQAYSLPKKHAIPKKPDETRVVKHVEAFFRTLPSTVDEFDHYSPAAFLLENRTKVLGEGPGVDLALDRFEKLFTDLNALL